MEDRVLYWVSLEADGVSTHRRLSADFPWILQTNWAARGAEDSYRQNRGRGKLLFPYGIWVNLNHLKAQPSLEF